MVRRISLTPSSSTQDVTVENPHTKIYFPSSPRELPVEVQGYSTATKVALGILGSLIFLYFVGLIHRIVTEADSQCNDEAEKCCKIGLRYLDQNNKAEAKKMYDKALGYHPSNRSIQARVYCGLGSLCDDDRKAIGYFTQVIELLHPGSAKNSREIGFSRVSEQDLSNLSFAYIKRAACYEALKQNSELALRDLQSALACNVRDHKSTILFGFSKVNARIGKKTEAFTKCIEAVRESLAPANTLLYLDFALSFLTEKNDQYADLLCQKANCFYHLQKYEEAVKVLDEALVCEIKSEDLKARIRMNRGVNQAEMKKLDLALKDFETALTFNAPSYKSALLFEISKVCFDKDDHQNAFDKCLEAIKESQDPNDTLQYYNCARAYLTEECASLSIQQRLQNFERLKTQLEGERDRISLQLADLVVAKKRAESAGGYVREIEDLERIIAEDMKGLREKGSKQVNGAEGPASSAQKSETKQVEDDFDQAD